MAAIVTHEPARLLCVFIATAQSLIAVVTARDAIYLRRLIIAIPLELEWGLADSRGEMKRPY